MAHAASPPLWPSSVPATAKPRLRGSAKEPTGNAAGPTAVADLLIFSVPTDGGSQSSKLISESEVGRAVALTSQWAGIADVAATLTADVIVVCGRASFVKFSQGCCANNLATKAKTRLADLALIFSIRCVPQMECDALGQVCQVPASQTEHTLFTIGVDDFGLSQATARFQRTDELAIGSEQSGSGGQGRNRTADASLFRAVRSITYRQSSMKTKDLHA